MIAIIDIIECSWKFYKIEIRVMKSNLVICVLEGKIELLLSIERKFRPMIFNFY